MKKLLLTSIALAVTAVGAYAQTAISQFTFETSFANIPTTAQTAGATVGPLAAEVGNGSASGFHATAATYSSPAGNGSGHSFSSNGFSVGDYYQFSLSTTGNSNIFVTFGMTGSNTGPTNFAFTFSLDNGANFTAPPNSAFVVTNDSWSATGAPKTQSEKTYDLTAFTALNNAANVIFRVTDTSTTAINGTTVASGGTARIDDFYVSSGGPILPVPEPSTYALVGLGLMSLLGVQRLRRRTC